MRAMSLLPFGTLPAYRPRRFVPERLDLGDWPQLAPLFERLATRGRSCTTAHDLERWLLDWSELNAALEEESQRRYIAMTCHTDDDGAEKAYLHFVEHIEPEVKPRQFELEKLHISLRYGADTVMDLSTGKDIDVIRQALLDASPVPVGTVVTVPGLEFSSAPCTLTRVSWKKCKTVAAATTNTVNAVTASVSFVLSRKRI